MLSCRIMLLCGLVRRVALCHVAGYCVVACLHVMHDVAWCRVVLLCVLMCCVVSTLRNTTHNAHATRRDNTQHHKSTVTSIRQHIPTQRNTTQCYTPHITTRQQHAHTTITRYNAMQHATQHHDIAQHITQHSTAL